ncbi:hypothetical protein DFH08DRAFT_952432 [Mycena albidolilacea]|uniref:Uncharacterized protein n=1 Tax=Mycena albidolilacea TaxID=1033008 RepID=A0AAD7EYG1_9AGAR|nr:hypothetical protein DFH08DRAFT_952432 [Mycena albidolilacea]
MLLEPFAGFTSPEALTALRDLRTSNPTSHAALSQTIELSEEADNDDGDDLFHGVDVYDDCDVPLAVIFDHLLSGGSLDPNFAEELEAEPAVLGRGQRHKIAARRYQGPAWEEH